MSQKGTDTMEIAANDDYWVGAGAGGSVHGYDSFIQTSFASSGVYALRIARFYDNPVPTGADYTLQISITDHAVPEPSTLLAGGLLILPFGLQAIRMWRKRMA